MKFHKAINMRFLGYKNKFKAPHWGGWGVKKGEQQTKTN